MFVNVMLIINVHTFVILAAGNGTRMCSNIPKIFTEIASKPMIRYVIECCKQFSQNIVVVTKEEFAKHDALRDVEVVIQKTPLGTGDALMCAYDLIDEYAIVLYADMPLITDEDLEKVISINSKAVITCFELDNDMMHMPYGRVICNSENKVNKIIEYSDANTDEQRIKLANAGIYKFHKSILNNVFQQNKEKYITDFCHNADIIICKYETAHGVNTQADLAYAENVIQNRLRTKFLQHGVKILDPKSVYFSSQMKIGSNVIIEQNIIFKGNVQIGNDCVIRAFSYVEDSIIGDKTKIGPFARLRGNAVTASNVEIGNFVEVKNSNIMQSAKIKHLSYIGDSEVGQNTNIGAGTITCNYDGKNKHKTVISDNCMIGANTSLVAPIKIGTNAKIAAGSTITDDVPDDTLAFGRARQVNKN